MCTAPCGRAELAPTRSLLPGRAVGDGLVVRLAHSPNGRLLAVLTTASIQLRNAEDGRLLNWVAHPLPMVRGLNWSPDSKRLALTAGGVEIWDPLSDRPERTIPSDPRNGDLDDVAWAPDGKQIAAGSKHAVIVFDLVSGLRTEIPAEVDRESLRNIKGGFSWAPDSSQLAVLAGAWDSEVVDLWDTRQQKLVKRIAVSDGKKPVCNSDACSFNDWALKYPKSLVAWSPDGQALAICSQYSGLSLWGRDSRLLWRQVKGYENGSQSRMFLDWSSDGAMLHVGSSGIRYVRRDTGATVFGNARWNNPISVSADERYSASWTPSGVDLWKGREPSPHGHFEVSMAWNLVAVSEDLTRMVARSMTGVNWIWDLATGKQLERLPAQVIGGFNSVWSPNLDLLAHVDRRSLKVVRVRDGSVQQTIKLKEGWYSLESGSWSPDGESVIAKGVSGTSSVVVGINNGRLTDPPSGSGPLVWAPSGALVRLPGQPAPICVQTPDRRWAVAVDSSWQMLKVWDVSHNPPAPGPEIRTYLSRREGTMLALSPDGKRIANAGPMVDIWDIASGRIVEHWTATDSSELQALVWREKLTAVDWLRGAVRLWQEP
jgi:WD40 repeat protein